MARVRKNGTYKSEKSGVVGKIVTSEGRSPSTSHVSASAYSQGLKKIDQSYRPDAPKMGR